MASKNSSRKQMITSLPTRYKQAIEVVEAAGGTVSDFVIELTTNAESHGLDDKEIIDILKNHYMSKNSSEEL